MTHAFRGLGLAVSFVLVSTVALVQEARSQSTPTAAAYVYIQIQGPEGAVYGFSATSTGKLSPIPGSPFKPAGQIIGSNKFQFLTLGQTLIHSYGLASDGALQSQLAQMPILDYAGSKCGSATGTDAAVLDHTGKYIYVVLEGGAGGCAGYQSYIINSDGSFSFDGDTELDWGPSGFDPGLPSILGNESFAYSYYLPGYFQPTLCGFRRESSGTLQLMQFQEPLPGGNDSPLYPDASPASNYVVLQLYPNDTNPPQLGSFMVDSEGNISTTNTPTDMPTAVLNNPGSTFSPSGNLFVLYADNPGNQGDGIQIFNFNGAAPLTPYTTLLSGTPIDGVAWDNSNHLYAISQSRNELYVFTVTPTSVTQEASWPIGAPYKMIVVSE
jgi:hypothetical protein